MALAMRSDGTANISINNVGRRLQISNKGVPLHPQFGV